MKVVALVSGGKDSCFAMMKYLDYGHEIIALANLMPVDDSVDEVDSYMYQTVGHQIIIGYAECMGLPLFCRRIHGSSRNKQFSYKITTGDEVEDLFILLNAVKQHIPSVSALSSGAIASDYQRLRVESVCARLGLVSLAYLWMEDQVLLEEMIRRGIVAIIIKVFLRELPRSLQKSEINSVLCSPEGRERLAMVGHASFALYYFLSQVAIEEDIRSNTTVMLLERMSECATPGWQKQLTMHQLGCVMLERGKYKDAQNFFEAAVHEGHAYSVVGVARAKYKKGHKYSAYKLLNSMISEHTSYGWMHQERSLYCSGNEKMTDLSTATDLDPTLSYPYKYMADTGRGG